ncbi:hypothetical protein CK203_114004 [Vitis vinifera]|uniref:Uncharacterized protein n=1 Tax=Vitis vinifera TaxID=29760 RepID=A0A438C999_VITVI|nr:hypothetical protein CK203_114004 [Vitis vinifera]
MDLGDTLGVRVESPCSHGSTIFDIAHTGFGIIYWEIWTFVSHHSFTFYPWPTLTVSITSGDIEGHILSFHSVYLPQVHDQR